MLMRYLIIPVLVFLAGACGSEQRSGLRPELSDTGEPALHAVSDARLRELMDQMNTLMYDRFQTQPEIDRERRDYSRKMAETANRLGNTVNLILTKLPTLNLNENEQATFRALADKLRRQAQTLASQAGQNQIDAIQPTLDGITHTCDSCHTLFRKLGH